MITTPPSSTGYGKCYLDHGDGKRSSTMMHLRVPGSSHFSWMSGTMSGPDVYLEHWPPGYETIMETMSTKEKTIKPLGPIGYLGQNGVYVTGGKKASNFDKGLELWKVVPTSHMRMPSPLLILLLMDSPCFLVGKLLPLKTTPALLRTWRLCPPKPPHRYSLP